MPSSLEEAFSDPYNNTVKINKKSYDRDTNSWPVSSSFIRNNEGTSLNESNNYHLKGLNSLGNQSNAPSQSQSQSQSHNCAVLMNQIFSCPDCRTKISTLLNKEASRENKHKHKPNHNHNHNHKHKHNNK